MKDLTQGSITGHILQMAVFMLLGMGGQALYYLVDLYFVSGIGPQAIAGVGAAGNVAFVVMALTQILAAGTLALIGQAVGRKDRTDANLVFNQSLVLSAICAAFTLVAGYLLAAPYLRSVGADVPMQEAGITFLYWMIPGLALQFAMVSMAAALRGTGIVQPVMTVQMLSVLLNIALAPVLIAGWGTGKPLGVAGAGLASTISISAAVLMLTVYFLRLEKYVTFHRDQWKPDFSCWKRVLNIGLPAGGEFFLMFLTMLITYWVIRDFGSDAQAGYGVGARVMQSIFVPAMAIAFAASPVAAQNFGAQRADRVRETYKRAAVMEVTLMMVLALLCHIAPRSMVAAFTDDPEVIAVATDFLRINSWNFAATGFVFTCSGLFQAIGNTWPALWSGVYRMAMYGLPALWMSAQPWFELSHLWYWSVITIFTQAALTFWLLRVQLNKRLAFPPMQASPVATSVSA